MFDSVNFRLTRSDYNGADFLSEMPCYITDVSEHHLIMGQLWLQDIWEILKYLAMSTR